MGDDLGRGRDGGRGARAVALAVVVLLVQGWGAARAAGPTTTPDPYEVQGPTIADPIRTLPGADSGPDAGTAAGAGAAATATTPGTTGTRAGAATAGGSAASAGRSAAAPPGSFRARMVESAGALGLQGLPLPPHQATSLRLPADPSALSDPVAASLRITADHPALVGLAPEGLEVAAVRRTPKIIYVHFRQSVEGLPVLHSRVTFQWDRRGRLRSTGADVYLDLDAGAGAIPGDRSLVAGTWLPSLQARAGALSGMPADLTVDEWEHEQRAWLPIVSTTGSGATGSEETGGFRLVPVWNLRFRTSSPPGWWDTVVDGETGVLLSRVNRLVTEDLVGQVTGLVEPVTAGDVPSTWPMRYQHLTVSDGSTSVETYTDAEGNYRAEMPAMGSYQLVSELSGRWIRVIDRSLGYVTPSTTSNVEVPGITNLAWNDSNSLPSHRDAYYHGTVAHDYIRQIDPGPALQPLDQSLGAVVEDGSGVCNAYWNGAWFTFYAAGGGCPSTARIADVVYHEYGHAVSSATYAPFFPPEDIGEGLSDYYAATITDSPIIGRGFFGPDTFIREIDTDRVWPDDRNPDPHIQGLIIAGALWDLRTELGSAVTDSLFHYTRYAAPMSYDDYFLDLLLVDDDDDDLTNGTPHFDPIIRAFMPHGIGDYDVRIAANELPDMETPGPTIETQGRIWSIFGLDPDSLALHVSFGEAGDFTTLPLVRAEDPREYRVEIPTPELETRVRYYWSAADTAGHRALLPSGAPEETFSFYVGADVIAPEITHTPVRVVPENLDHLYFRADVSDNSQRLGSVTAVYRTAADVEPRSGSLTPMSEGPTYEAYLELGPIAAGEDILYHLVAVDQAVHPNTRMLPSTGDFTISVRAGEGYDLESSNGGLAPQGDWQWGIPSEDRLAYSGSHVWATVLDGPYTDQSSSVLMWGPIDLTGFDRAQLRFHHIYQIEEGYDGGVVEIALTSGDWERLTPVGGYPFGSVDVTGQPGYSGSIDDWETAIFPLDAYLGERIRIRFKFDTDVYVGDLGWYIDDPAVVASQALVAPRNLQAVSGEDSRVRLLWQNPAGVDLGSGRFLGFDVYRAEGDGPFGENPLNTQPITTLSFVDETAVNDVTYTYRVHAVYDEGLSDGILATATPAAPSIGVDLTAVDEVVDDYETRTTTFQIRNQATGTLNWRIFLGNGDSDLEDVRAAYDLPGELTTDFERVFEDPAGDVPDPGSSGPAPDLQAIELRRWVDESQNPMLEIRIVGHAPWGDPAADWGGVLFLDTDGDLRTSQTQDLGYGESVNLGWEWGVVFGKFPSQIPGLGNGLAYLFEPTFSRLPMELTDVDFPADSDSLSFSIPLSALGSTSRFETAVFVARNFGEPALDAMPDLPDAGWLTRVPKQGGATSVQASEVTVTLDATGLRNGSYAARLLLASNDPDSPVLTIPVNLQVDRLPPPDLASLEFASDLSGIEVAFHLRPEVAADSVFVERASVHEEDWTPVGDGTLWPNETGLYHFVDPQVRSATPNRYRFPIRLEDGGLFTYGPYSRLYTPELPELVSNDFVSDSAGIAIAFSVPEELLPSRARIERSETPDQWELLTDEPLEPDAGGRFEYHDDDVAVGAEYAYRFDILLDTGPELVYGPFSTSYVPPIPNLQALEFAPELSGLELSFQVPRALEAHVERRTGTEGEWQRLTTDALVPDDEDRFAFLDGRARPKVDYSYRFPVSLATGQETVYGPYDAVYEPILPYLETQSSVSAEEGLHVEFQLLLPEGFTFESPVQIERMDGGLSGDWAVVSPDDLYPSEDGSVEMLDRWATPWTDGVEPDQDYRYRLRIPMSEGDDLLYGPFEATFEPPLPSQVQLHPGRPNPFRDQVVLRLDLPTAQRVKLEIYDPTGRRRAVPVDGDLGAGIHHLVWDGRDELGEDLPSGVYWVRLETAGKTRTLRLVRTK